MDDCVHLTPGETVAGREFTDPAETPPDLRVLARMLGELRRQLGRGASLPAHPRPLVLERHEADGRVHRTIICNLARLGDGTSLGWVGFFGVKRRDVDGAPLVVRDEELIREFPDHPGILSYSSLELDGGDWGNLILLDGDEAREHWRTSERHAHAARELAPRHYVHVRLHQGILPGGVRGAFGPVLRRTKYFDYRGGIVWRADRESPS